MSINYKRMSNLIEQEVSKLPDLSASQRERLKKLMDKVYLMESTQSTSAQSLIEEIMSEMSLVADLWKAEGNQ